MELLNVNLEIRNEFEGREEDASASNETPIRLLFDGQFLSIIVNNQAKIEKFSFQAVSGVAQTKDGKSYFTYEKERQALKNEGPIPEGEYFITPLSENINEGVQFLELDDEFIGVISIAASLASNFIKLPIKKFGKFYGGSYAWGAVRILIQPKTRKIISSQNEEIIRADFFIHGGASAGSAGCIDLWKNNNDFFKVLLEYVKQNKDQILQNQGKIPLSVKYDDGLKINCDDKIYLQAQNISNYKFKKLFLFTTNGCRLVQ
ncbi:hypothetical protein DMC01_12830 [Campylobacter troglodytis]|nr:hypothetical protein DMC01_12830 [Campylobacter troglodytis]